MSGAPAAGARPGDAARAAAAEVPLATVALAPEITGPRAAWRALALHVTCAETRHAGGPLDRALWGAGQVGRAVRVLLRDRRLLNAALLPTALTLSGCAALAWMGFGLDDDEPTAGRFQVFLTAFIALSSMPPTLLQRMWIRVANEARRALGLPAGEDPFPGERYGRMLIREWGKAMRQAFVVSAGIVPLVAIVRLLPFGRSSGATLAAAWAFYWVVIDAFELPLEVVPGPRHGGPEPWFSRALRRVGRARRLLRPALWLARLLDGACRPWREEIAFSERHAWESAGFGAAVGAVLAIPIAGVFFRAVGIVGATALQARLAEGAAPGAADGQPVSPPPLDGSAAA